MSATVKPRFIIQYITYPTGMKNKTNVEYRSNYELAKDTHNSHVSFGMSFVSISEKWT